MGRGRIGARPPVLRHIDRQGILPQLAHLHRRGHAAWPVGGLFRAPHRRRHGPPPGRHLPEPARRRPDPADRRRQWLCLLAPAPQEHAGQILCRAGHRPGGIFAGLRQGLWRDRPGRFTPRRQYGRPARGPPRYRRVHHLQDRRKLDHQLQHLGGHHRCLHGSGGA